MLRALLLVTTALALCVRAVPPGGCFNSSDTSPPLLTQPPLFSAVVALSVCAFPNELTLRPGARGTISVAIGTGLDFIVNGALFILPPSIDVALSCANRTEYLLDSFVPSEFPLLIDAIGGVVVYNYSINTANSEPRAVPLAGSTTCRAVVSVRSFNGVLLARNETAPACSEATMNAGVDYSLVACTPNITVGTVNAAAVAVTLAHAPPFTPELFPAAFASVLTCDAVSGVTLNGSTQSTELLLPPTVPSVSGAATLTLRRDVPLNQSLGCRLQLYETLVGRSTRREYVSRRRNVTCAVPTVPPARETRVQSATCGPLLLGTENRDALSVQLCRSTNDGQNVTIGVRFECTDTARYHAPTGRDRVFETFLGTGPLNECRTVHFSVVLTGTRDSLRSDVTCRFQGLDTLQQDDTGALTTATAPCTSESLASSATTPPPSPTPVAAPTPAPTPTPTPGSGSGLSTASIVTISVCALLLAGYLAFWIYSVSRRPRPIKLSSTSDKDTMAATAKRRQQAEDAPLLPKSSPAPSSSSSGAETRGAWRAARPSPTIGASRNSIS